MLYDDAEQMEVRHVISLEHHDVSIYGGPEEIPEGELWIKRNAICLSRNKQGLTANQAASLPFFLFSENCSEKEDFYFALLKNQEKLVMTSTNAPLPLEYGTQDIVTLVKKLHSSEQQIQTRWLNALIGRLFLAMYKTPELEDFVRQKMTKKISRVKKPNFITKIILQKIEMGEGAPLITNPKLKDLTVDGDCVAEADVNYTGKFRIEIAATARLDLGTRFKAREVDIVLAVVVNKIEGHGLLRFKPPPSNRIWVAFETMPALDLKIEPIVSTRQITYNLVLRAIESRVREVFAETMVLPFWDDIPFMDTADQEYRGGIWKRAVQVQEPVEIEQEIPEDQADADESSLEADSLKIHDEKSMSDPVLASGVSSGPKSPAGKAKTWTDDEASTPSTVEKSHRADPPRAIRSTSFQASMADPMVSPSHADSRRDSDNAGQTDSARNMLRELSNKNSISASPTESAAESPPNESTLMAALRAAGRRRTASKDSSDRPSSSSTQQASETSSLRMESQGSSNAESTSHASPNTSNPYDTSRTAALASSIKSAASNIHTPSQQSEKRTLPAIANATTAAKNWGWGVLARQQARREQQQQAASPASKPDKPNPNKTPTPTTPMGRGQPLPPPGQPLPHPERSLLSSIPLPKRRMQGTSPPPLHGRLERNGSGSGNGSSSDTGNGDSKASGPGSGKRSLRRPAPKRLPTPSERRTRQQSGRGSTGRDASTEGLDDEEELLVVQAPVDSNPSSPADGGDDDDKDSAAEGEKDGNDGHEIEIHNGFVEDAEPLGDDKIVAEKAVPALDGNISQEDSLGEIVAPKLPPRR